MRMSDTETTEMTVAEMLDFATQMAKDEIEEFEGDVPDHAPGMIAARATNLIQTVQNFDMMRAMENVDDPSDDSITRAIEEDAVDILLGVAVLELEYDIDLIAAIDRRKQLVEDYKAFEKAMEDVETREDAIEAVDEHMTEELEQAMAQGAQSMGGFDTGGIETGMNVDNEEYEHEEMERSFA